MRKLKLDLNDLHVEAFTTDGESAARGTVLGRAEETDQVLCGQTEASCYHTCEYSCAAGCGTAPENCGGTYYRTCWGNYTCIDYSRCDPSCDC